MAALFTGLSKFLFGGGGGGKVTNHVSAVTPPALTDPSVNDAGLAARAAAARAMGRASTVATSGQGDTSAPITKKTALGG
jgi:hypothetical protein